MQAALLAKSPKVKASRKSVEPPNSAPSPAGPSSLTVPPPAHTPAPAVPATHSRPAPAAAAARTPASDRTLAAEYPDLYKAAYKGATQVPAKCGECKFCINPILKQACVVKAAYREQAGFAACRAAAAAQKKLDKAARKEARAAAKATAAAAAASVAAAISAAEAAAVDSAPLDTQEDEEDEAAAAAGLEALGTGGVATAVVGEQAGGAPAPVERQTSQQPAPTPPPPPPAKKRKQQDGKLYNGAYALGSPAGQDVAAAAEQVWAMVFLVLGGVR